MAYSPAGNLTTSAGLAHLQSVYYKKKALDRLQKKFVFRGVTVKDMLPKFNGKTAQWYRYQNLTAATTPTTEGTVGSSGTVSSRVVGATVSQYSAFITVSDILMDTAIDPIVDNTADLLGYQAAISVDTITRNVIDAEESSGGGTSGPGLALLSTYMRVQDIRNGRSKLANNDVQPMEDGWFHVIMNPFVSYDLLNDPAASGFADLMKYNTDVKNSSLVKYEDRGLIGYVAGAKIIESTNVKTFTSPNRYRVYMFGKGGVGSLDLEGRGPSEVTDPKAQRFKINVVKGGPSIPDPEGVIGAAVSYNFVFTALVLEGPAGIGGSYRYRVFDPQSTLG